MAQPLVLPIAGFPCQFPLLIPLSPKSLLLTWNPSSLRGATLVHPGPRLLVNWPTPPHSESPSPQGFPKSVERPSKTTSQHRLHIVQNTKKQGKIHHHLQIYTTEHIT